MNKSTIIVRRTSTESLNKPIGYKHPLVGRCQLTYRPGEIKFPKIIFSRMVR